MSFKRSWSRRLAAILSAVMVVSTAAPVSVPAMEAQADDILSPAVTEENNSSHVMDDEALVAEDGAALTAGEDTLLDAGDELAAELTDGALTDEPAEDLELIDETDTLIEEPEEASAGPYTGALRLNTTNAGLVKKIEYKFDDGAWQELDVSTDGLKAPINFNGINKITFRLKDAPDSGDTIPLNDINGYQVNFVAGGFNINYFNIINQSNHEATFILDEFGFKQNGIFKINMDTVIHERYKKKGNLVIHVAHENPIPGTNKIISINNVSVQFSEYAIAYDVSGNIIPGDYRNSASENHIDIAGYSGTITLPYWCAKSAIIKINDTDSDSGNEENGTRYAYTIGDDLFYSSMATGVSDGDKKKYTIELAKGLDFDTHVTIGVKKVSDPEIKFSTVSNHIMTGFTVEADDGCGGTPTPYNIDATSDTEVKTQVFTRARKLSFDYDNFVTRSGAETEFSGGWIYRIEYKDTEGKDVSRSLYPSENYKKFDIMIDNNDRFPDEIRVSAIPKVRVTLTTDGTKRYNRNKNDVFKRAQWKNDYDTGHNDDINTGEYSFWVEPGRTVSIDYINRNYESDYIFPYVEGASPVFEGEDSLLQFTLPEISENKVFNVSFYEFGIDEDNLFSVTNGTRSDGQPGKASVSINGLGGFGANWYTDDDPASQLFGKRVLGAKLYGYGYIDKKLELKIKMNSTESYEYEPEKIGFNFYDFSDSYQSQGPIIEKEEIIFEGFSRWKKFTKFEVSKDEQGNNIATVFVPARWVLFTLIKNGKFELTVTEREKKRQNRVALAEGNPGTIKTASAKVGGEHRCAIRKAELDTYADIFYGSDVFLNAEPAEGYRLVSVDFKYPSNSDNNETITDAKKLAAFTSDEGYKYKLYEDVNVIFNTEPVYCTSVRYKTGTDELEPKNGKYSIDHKRPVIVQYKKGSATPAEYKCDIFVGSVKTDSNEGIGRSGNNYTVDASKGSLAGKNVTFKFYTGDGGKTDSSLQVVTLVFDKADTGVKFGADKYTVPLGADREFNVNITGTFEAVAILASDKAYNKTGLDFSIDTSKKKLVIKSTADSKPDTYTINIVNPNDPTVVYGSVKIELETATVKTARAPMVRIIGTTNRGVTVGLKVQKVDTMIKGLYYELRVITKEQKKNYFKSIETVYVPVMETSKYVDMFTDAAKSNSEYAGDPDAVFVATARLVQLKADNKTFVIGSDSWSDEKDGTFSTKEGYRYETKLRLKRISKGTIYNTMSSGNAYRFGVVYSKKTAIQRLDPTKLELLTGSGEEVTYPDDRSMKDFISIENDYTIAFYPGGNESVNGSEKCLPPGTYIIKAYALEPNSIEVSATIKVKVERGVTGFKLSGVSGVIYKQPGKSAGMQLTVKGKNGKSEFDTRKVRFEICDEKNTGGLVKISKGGKITISRKLELGNTTFKVKIIADDFKRSHGTEEIFAERQIKVVSSYEVGEMSLAYDNSADFSRDKIARLENSYFIHELLPQFSDLGKKAYALRWQFAPEFWITVFDRNTRDGKLEYIPVDFKVSGAGRVLETKNTAEEDENGTHGTCARIMITDIDKDINITAYANDGSGRKIKNYKVRIKSVNGELGIYISDEQNAQNIKHQNVLSWDYGNTNLTFDSYAMEKDGMNMLICSEYADVRRSESEAPVSAVKYRISSLRGGRIAKVRFYHSKIYPTAPQTTFTVTDMTNGKNYRVTINNKGYVDRSKKTQVTISNRTYDAKKGSKTVNGVIYSHLDFSSATNYSDYDDALWNTVKFHVDSAENDQYVMVEVVSSVKRVRGEYKVVTKPLGECLNTLMTEQSNKEENENDKIERSGIAYPIKLTGKDFTIDFYDRKTNTFDMLPGSYNLIITPVRREGYFRYRALACPTTVTLKVVTPPKANVKPAASVAFGTSEGTVTKGQYSYFLKSPVYKEQGILYKELKSANIDGSINTFRKNFRITDNRTGKLEYVGNETIGSKDKDRDKKLQGWLILQYQKVDGTVVEEPVKIKIAAKGDIRKK